MKAGDRVKTPAGLGTVVFVRYVPPDFTRVGSISVRMDKNREDPHYVGTVWQASAVKMAENEESGT